MFAKNALSFTMSWQTPPGHDVGVTRDDGELVDS